MLVRVPSCARTLQSFRIAQTAKVAELKVRQHVLRQSDTACVAGMILMLQCIDVLSVFVALPSTETTRKGASQQTCTCSCRRGFRSVCSTSCSSRAGYV